jgi:hypothetical protein
MLESLGNSQQKVILERGIYAGKDFDSLLSIMQPLF